jgi:hypothetical protein
VKVNLCLYALEFMKPVSFKRLLLNIGVSVMWGLIAKAAIKAMLDSVRPNATKNEQENAIPVLCAGLGVGVSVAEYVQGVPV